MSNLIPAPMTRDQLVAVLTDILEHVKSGDSFEGNIEYLMPDEFAVENGDPPAGWGKWPTTDCEFWVTGAYRVGNLWGQGGMAMVGEVPR